MGSGLGRDELRVDLDRLAEAAHAAFQKIAHAELAADFLGVDRLALVGEGGVAGDDEGVGQLREVGRQIVGDSVGEILLLRIAAEVLERQHDDRKPRRGLELVLGDRGAEQTRREPRMPGVGAGRDKRDDERGGERRPACEETARGGRCRLALRLGLRLRGDADLQRIGPDRLGNVLELGRA